LKLRGGEWEKRRVGERESGGRKCEWKRETQRLRESKNGKMK